MQGITHKRSQNLRSKYLSDIAIIKGPVGINTSNKLAFNFPSHNAALQCFNISHKTQLAFQIRALTFSSRQADWYLHNLDGLSLLCCPRAFVSNVHTQATTDFGLTSVTGGSEGRKITGSETVGAEWPGWILWAGCLVRCVSLWLLKTN